MHSDPCRTARCRALTMAVGASLILSGCGGAPELAGRAMRGLAQAVRLGPPVDVMKACGDRYLKD